MADILELIDNIKTKITDAEYMKLMETLKDKHEGINDLYEVRYIETISGYSPNMCSHCIDHRLKTRITKLYLDEDIDESLDEIIKKINNDNIEYSLGEMKDNKSILRTSYWVGIKYQNDDDDDVDIRPNFILNIKKYNE